MGCIPSDRLEETDPDPPSLRPVFTQRVPDLPEGLDPVAVCIFNSSVIMLHNQTTRKKLGVHSVKIGQLTQVPIRTSRQLNFHAARLLTTLKEKPKSDSNLNVTAKLGIVQLTEGNYVVVVCHSNGKFEWVRCSTTLGRSKASQLNEGVL